MLTRRDLIVGSAGVLVTAAARPLFGQEEKPVLPVVVSTWTFGRKANAEAWKILEKGGSALDAVEAGVTQAELDPANESVGYGGRPNEAGETTLDAMIMWGPAHAAGAVGCLKRVKRAISVARKVMEKTNHTFLVGEDATQFALKMGFKEEPLANERSKKAYEAWKKAGRKPSQWKDAHDTIGMIAVDKKGDVCAGCSTNGLPFKIAGRVGDSPITGAGAYCDNEAGAAAATGNGDVMMRFLPAYQAVENMRRGMAPDAACREALARIGKKGYDVGGALIAVNRKGVFGAARMKYATFPFAVRNPSLDDLKSVP
ncbi:MAG: N(4)-(beta-N-acetylglucosaminyl)-L-asparaginase [Planctomycetota bacterium]|jgi:N4-(beta-N-acetylglucosaminyl)-L-asparaginase